MFRNALIKGTFSFNPGTSGVPNVDYVVSIRERYEVGFATLRVEGGNKFTT